MVRSPVSFAMVRSDVGVGMALVLPKAC